MFFTHVKKIQVQKTHKTNYIPNLPTSIVVRNKGDNRSNFDNVGAHFFAGIWKYGNTDPNSIFYHANLGVIRFI